MTPMIVVPPSTPLRITDLPPLLPAHQVPVMPPLAVAASAGFLPPLDDAFPAVLPNTTEGAYLTWSEVAVRNRRKGKGGAATGDREIPHTVQFSFVTD